MAGGALLALAVGLANVALLGVSGGFLGSMAAAREKGLVRQEGKDYVVQDGDVMLFKFNV